MKADALALFRSIQHAENDGETPREAGRRLGIHLNRVAGLCEKWSRKGWYQYTECAELGWLTNAGVARLGQMEGAAEAGGPIDPPVSDAGGGEPAR
ncbi:MAG: hypothetical protein CMJ83_08595 [Planctomycetes bacterium]|nr:hypothetical protein [Planctomycetota bacterium]